MTLFYKAVPAGFVEQDSPKFTMVPKICTTDIRIAANQLYLLKGGSAEKQNSAVVIEITYDGDIYPYTEDSSQVEKDRQKSISRWKDKANTRASILSRCSYRVVPDSEVPNRMLKLS